MLNTRLRRRRTPYLEGILLITLGIIFTVMLLRGLDSQAKLNYCKDLSYRAERNLYQITPQDQNLCGKALSQQ